MSNSMPTAMTETDVTESLIPYVRDRIESVPSLSGIHFIASRAWASNQDNFRARIRQSVVNMLGTNLSSLDQANILDLEARPTLRHNSISISHCPDLGAYVVGSANSASDPRQFEGLGLDVETALRVSRAAVQRIYTRANDKAAPEAWAQASVAIERYADLWTIKEAALKAASNALRALDLEDRFLVYSDLIVDAQPRNPKFTAEYSSLAANLHIEGFVCQWRGLSVAIAGAKRI